MVLRLEEKIFRCHDFIRVLYKPLQDGESLMQCAGQTSGYGKLGFVLCSRSSHADCARLQRKLYEDVVCPLEDLEHALHELYIGDPED